MTEALKAMGVVVTEPDATTFIVESTGKLRKPGHPLFLGNAGTATRFLTAAAALVDGEVVITCDEHMQRRPIQPLLDALKQLGVEVECATGCPPVTVYGKGVLTGTRVTLDATLSSQYLSAVLMLAPTGPGPLQINLEGTDIGAHGYIDLTLRCMREFGAHYEQTDTGSWKVFGEEYKATDYYVEPDASAATYFWAASALTGGDIDLGILPQQFCQPDAGAAKIMAQFPNMPSTIDGSQMQDAVPAMAVLAAFNNTPVRFIGISNLRVKECDRIQALHDELNRILPGLAEQVGDDLVVCSNPDLMNEGGRMSVTQIETYHDHRIAMSLALAGLKVGSIQLRDPGCVAKTFPGYWRALASLGVELRETF